MATDIDQSHYNTGTATVAGTAVTGQGTTWLGTVRKGDLFGTHKGSGVRIASVDNNTSLTLAYAVPALEQTAAPYEIQRTPFDVGYYQALENLLVLLGGGNLEAFAGLNGLSGKLPMFTGPATLDLISKFDLVSGVKFDVQVADIAARAAYDTQAAGFAVLVGNTGDGRSAIYSKVSNTGGDWSAPSYLTGPSITLDVTQVDEVPYGTPPEVNMTARAGGYDMAFDIPRGMIIEPGTTTTLAPDQPAAVTFVPVAGGYRLDIALPRGPTGDIDGVTPFWVSRLGSDADAAAARVGLGAVGGPSEAVDGYLALFSGTTGKLIKAALTLPDASMPERFGTSAVANSALITQAQLDNFSALATGVYRVGSPTGLPSGSYVVEIVRFGPSNILERVWRINANSNIGFFRTLTSTGEIPAWTPLQPEYGSNANGSYVRFADGTQISKHALSVTNVSNAFGGIFASSSEPTWTFPTSFISPPDMYGNDAGSENIWVAARASTATTGMFRAVCGLSIGSARTIRLTAIGRWF